MSVDFVIKAYLNVLDVDEVVARAKFVNGGFFTAKGGHAILFLTHAVDII